MVDPEITRLIARLKNCKKPDRKLDRDIYETIMPDYSGEPPEFTGRLTAALILFPNITAIELCMAALILREQLD